MSVVSAERSHPIRVMLVDDHAVVRAGYQRLLALEPDFVVTAECADGDAVLTLLQAATELPADLMVLDLAMPGRSGLDLLQRVGIRWPSLRVLVFSMHDNPAMVMQALRAGAAGYVTKSSPPELLVQALRRVAAGEHEVLSPDIARARHAPAAQAPHLTLSAREFQVLQGLVAGRSVDEIAEQMHLSAKTVANYQTLIRQKLKVNTAVELLRYAQQHGLFQA